MCVTLDSCCITGIPEHSRASSERMARSVQIAVMPTTQTNRSWGRAELNPPRVYALRERCNEDRYVLFSCRECIEHSRFHGIGCHWHKPWSQRSVPVLVSEWIRDLLLWCVGTSVVERLVPCLALSPCPILHIGSIGWCDSNGDCLPHDTRVSSEWRAVLAESPPILKFRVKCPDCRRYVRHPVREIMGALLQLCY